MNCVGGRGTGARRYGLGVTAQPEPDVVSTTLALVAQELEIITGSAVEVPAAEQIYRRDLMAAWAL